MIRGLLTLAAVSVLAIAAAGDAQAQNTGLQTIGLASFSPADVTRTGDIIITAARQRGGEFEVTFLYTFAPANPFGNATALAQYVLPRLPANARLRLTYYAGFRTWDPMDWAAFTAARPTQAQQLFVNGFLAKVQGFDQWAVGLRNWAAAARVNDRLGITFCASLEDDCPNPAAYTAMLGRVQGQQARDGVATQLRRCSLDTNVFRAATPAGVSIPLEIHGRWAAVAAAAQRAGVRLGAGDCFSNDGTELAPGQFLPDQAAARAAGVNVFYWRAVFNGGPRDLHPSRRGVLKPFTGTNGGNESAGALQVVSSR